MVAVVTVARGFFLIYVTVVWRHPKEKAAYNISIICRVGKSTEGEEPSLMDGSSLSLRKGDGRALF